MGLQRLVRADWQSYCERISRGISAGQRAELEIVSLDLGDHLEARWLPMWAWFTSPRPICSRWRSKGSTTWLRTRGKCSSRHRTGDRGRRDRRGRRRAAHRPVARAAVFVAAQSFRRAEPFAKSNRRVASW